MATVRARAGVLPKEDLLLYVHGGVAIADISFESTIDDGPRKNVSNDETQTGWVAGAGAEYALVPSTFLFVEYSYMDFGEQSATSSETPQNVDQDSELHAVKVGVNFKIGHGHM